MWYQVLRAYVQLNALGVRHGHETLQKQQFSCSHLRVDADARPVPDLQLVNMLDSSELKANEETQKQLDACFAYNNRERS